MNQTHEQRLAMAGEPVPGFAPPRPFRLGFRCGVAITVAVVLSIAGWGATYWARDREHRRQTTVAEQLRERGGETRFWNGRGVQVTFSGAAVDRTAIGQLAGLPQLRRLVLIDVGISPDALDGLAELAPSLREFVVINARIGDDGATHVGRCRDLTQLRLTRAGITDQGIARLRELRALTRLDLQHNAITDEALSHLAGMENLEQIQLGGTRVTREGAQSLQLSLPKANIHQ